MNPMQQELQNWTVGTLNQCKLIKIKSRFALIHRKEQETKMPQKMGSEVDFVVGDLCRLEGKFS